MAGETTFNSELVNELRSELTVIIGHCDMLEETLSNSGPGLIGEFEQAYGGPPFGKTFSQWLKHSPAFLMDQIETPLRIQTIGPVSLVLDWHWYTGLSRLSKPVEMIYIPEGTHTLEKPWDRVISLQGNVDWFCFWIKGEEDPDPAKAEQYKRWRELRRLHDGQPVSQKPN